MAFTATLSSGSGAATIHLAGELDASTAPDFHEAIDDAVATGAGRLVIDASELTYIASAGLRALVFARQKVAEDVVIAITGVTEPVLKVIRMAGLDHGFAIATS
ncbi:STAS domain-containing protein [Sphaerisporangium perillae]|uniref:STAS domain-containing protein n=1 Tax=Sphaerisporangium perillae TaxID=2935860 RepID=UPI00200D9988|nr:STAS domain-containing protein [Sphaerisporangium perillae]